MQYQTVVAAASPAGVANMKFSFVCVISEVARRSVCMCVFLSKSRGSQKMLRVQKEKERRKNTEPEGKRERESENERGGGEQVRRKTSETQL